MNTADGHPRARSTRRYPETARRAAVGSRLISAGERERERIFSEVPVMLEIFSRPAPASLTPPWGRQASTRGRGGLASENRENLASLRQPAFQSTRQAGSHLPRRAACCFPFPIPTRNCFPSTNVVDRLLSPPPPPSSSSPSRPRGQSNSRPDQRRRESVLSAVGTVIPECRGRDSRVGWRVASVT